MDTYIGLKVIQAQPAFEPKENIIRRTGDVSAPALDGYTVVYEDGYESWSPLAAFDSAYRKVEGGLPFSIALEAMKRGQRWARHGWNGQGMYVEAQFPDDHSKMSRPYLFMKTVDDALVPWVASQSDLLADDWFHVS